MSTSKAETFEPLGPDDIITGDPISTVWRWCARNGWTFTPDFLGGEPKIDQRCAWALVAPDVAFETARKGVLLGIKRYPGGTVLLSDVTRLKESMG
jgi:hypothetical protein